MRLLADQDVYSVTIAFLRGAHHDVVTAAELQLSQASDSEILDAAMKERRILVTRDRDFGSLVFVNRIQAGVIYLRVLPATVDAVHDELLRVMEQYREDELLRALVVVEPGRHRLRRTTT